MTSTSPHENGAAAVDPVAAAPAPRLVVDGLVRGTHTRPGVVAFDRASLARLPESAQVPDVGRLVRGKVGRGVRFHALATAAGADPRAAHVHLASADPRFAISVPLSEVLANALVVYELDGLDLPESKGGPFRFLACGHPDECVHVKGLSQITLSDRPGRDTRPRDDAEHRALHERARTKQ